MDPTLSGGSDRPLRGAAPRAPTHLSVFGEHRGDSSAAGGSPHSSRLRASFRLARGIPGDTRSRRCNLGRGCAIVPLKTLRPTGRTPRREGLRARIEGRPVAEGGSPFASATPGGGAALRAAPSGATPGGVRRSGDTSGNDARRRSPPGTSRAPRPARRGRGPSGRLGAPRDGARPRARGGGRRHAHASLTRSLVGLRKTATFEWFRTRVSCSTSSKPWPARNRSIFGASMSEKPP